MHISNTVWKVLIICAQIVLVVCTTPSVYQTDTGKQYPIDPSEEYNWYQAKHACSLHNSQLVILDTLEKSHHLQAILEKHLSEFKNLWIGGRIGDKDITKVQKKSVYWHAEKPANKNSTADQCVYISNNSQTPYTWMADSCYKRNGFICEESKLAWKNLIRKAIRKTQINIARSLFTIENIIAMFRGSKEKDE